MSISTPAAPTSRYLLDRSLASLRDQAFAWTRVGIRDRIELLEGVSRRMMEVAPDLVADGCRAKGIPERMAGEEWVAGPLSVLRTVRFLRSTLIGIDRHGDVPVPDSAIRERPDGQVTVDVMPGDGWDRILYPGVRATVRMDPVVRYSQARHALGGIYTKSVPVEPAVSLVLGAGNVASISPLDVIHQLFVEGRVTMLKFSPVNDYIGPHVEHAFAELMAAGFVRTSYGGVDVGDHLVTHPEVDAIHITGSDVTHDAIVFGAGADGRRRKQAGETRVDKPITSELGNVSPVVVVPGRWSGRAMRYQAGHIATQLVQNGGYNCNAAKVLVLPAEWEQRDEFVAALTRRLHEAPERPPYYPGSAERFQAIIDGGGPTTACGPGGTELPPTLIEVDPTSDHPAFTEEAFCRILAVVDLPGDDPAAFLEGAVRFCNERLKGTLNVTLVFDRDTAREHRPAIDAAVDELRYGSVGLNLWAAAAFPLGVTPWGAYPGHTIDDIGSGIGFVHNARLIDRPQKTVMSGPFVQVPTPPWSVFHRRSGAVLRRASAFEADPAWWRLPGILATALAV